MARARLGLFALNLFGFHFSGGQGQHQVDVLSAVVKEQVGHAKAEQHFPGKFFKFFVLFGSVAEQFYILFCLSFFAIKMLAKMTIALPRATAGLTVSFNSSAPTTTPVMGSMALKTEAFCPPIRKVPC